MGAVPTYGRQKCSHADGNKEDVQLAAKLLQQTQGVVASRGVPRFGLRHIFASAVATAKTSATPGRTLYETACPLL